MFYDKVSEHVDNHLVMSVDGAAMRAGVQTGDRIIKVTDLHMQNYCMEYYFSLPG